MMILKLLGCAGVLGATAGVGWYFSIQERKRLIWLREFLGCITYMESSLRFCGGETSELIRGCAERCTGKLKFLFECLWEQIQQQALPNVGACMKVALEQYSMPKPLDELLLQFGNQLGQFDIEGQIAVLEPVKRDCLTAYQSAFANQPVVSRNYKTLGLCAGFTLIILLI